MLKSTMQIRRLKAIECLPVRRIKADKTINSTVKPKFKHQNGEAKTNRFKAQDLVYIVL